MITTADHLALYGIFMMIFGTVGNFFWYKETTMYLYKKGQISKMFESLEQISKINRKKFDPITIQNKLEITSVDLRVQTVSIVPRAKPTCLSKMGRNIKTLCSIITTPKLLLYTISFSTQASALYLIFYGASTTVSESLGFGTIQVNEMVLGACHIVGYSLMLPFLSKIRRKKSTIIFLTIYVILAAVLAACDLTDFHSQKADIYKWVVTVSALFINTITSSYFSVFFIYAAELFPTKVRGVGIGFSVLIGKVVGAFATYVTDWGKELKLNVMVLCCAPAALALPFVLCLTETNAKKKKI
jgi:hypothetical protein